MDFEKQWQEAQDAMNMQDWKFVEQKSGLSYLEILTSGYIGAAMAKAYVFLKFDANQGSVPWQTVEKMTHGELKAFMAERGMQTDQELEQVEQDGDNPL